MKIEGSVQRGLGGSLAGIALLIGFIFVSCASAPNRDEGFEPYTRLDPIPGGKAVVYMYHNLDIATVLSGQLAAFYPSSYDPKGNMKPEAARKYPGVVETYPGDTARFVVDPTDNKMVILTRLGKSSGGGTRKTKIVELEGLKAGDVVYVDVSLNGSTKTINAAVVPEAELLSLIEQAKLRKPTLAK